LAWPVGAGMSVGTHREPGDEAQQFVHLSVTVRD